MPRFSSGTFALDTYTFNAGPAVALTATASDQFPVGWWGAVGDDATDNSTFIMSAIASITATGGGTLVFATGTYKVQGGAGLNGVTVPSNVQLAFKQGGMLWATSASGVVTINGSIAAHPTQQIFVYSGTGAFLLTGQADATYPVKWWGAQGDDAPTAHGFAVLGSPTRVLARARVARRAWPASGAAARTWGSLPLARGTGHSDARLAIGSRAGDRGALA